MIMGGNQRSTLELPPDLHAAHVYSNLRILGQKPWCEDIYGVLLSSGRVCESRYLSRVWNAKIKGRTWKVVNGVMLESEETGG